MRWLKTVGREIYGLFVDDGLFAVSILLCVGLVWLLAARAPISATSACVLLFAGPGVILAESVLRFARSHSK